MNISTQALALTRERFKLTQMQVATALGFSKSYISRIERGALEGRSEEAIAKYVTFLVAHAREHLLQFDPSELASGQVHTRLVDRMIRIFENGVLRFGTEPETKDPNTALKEIGLSLDARIPNIANLLLDTIDDYSQEYVLNYGQMRNSERPIIFFTPGFNIFTENSSWFSFYTSALDRLFLHRILTTQIARVAVEDDKFSNVELIARGLELALRYYSHYDRRSLYDFRTLEGGAPPPFPRDLYQFRDYACIQAYGNEKFCVTGDFVDPPNINKGYLDEIVRASRPAVTLFGPTEEESMAFYEEFGSKKAKEYSMVQSFFSLVTRPTAEFRDGSDWYGTIGQSFKDPSLLASARRVINRNVEDALTRKGAKFRQICFRPVIERWVSEGVRWSDDKQQERKDDVPERIERLKHVIRLLDTGRFQFALTTEKSLFGRASWLVLDKHKVFLEKRIGREVRLNAMGYAQPRAPGERNMRAVLRHNEVGQAFQRRFNEAWSTIPAAEKDTQTVRAFLVDCLDRLARLPR